MVNSPRPSSSVLPPGLVSVLLSPCPYLIGVLSGTPPRHINPRLVRDIGETVIFDLDGFGNEPEILNPTDRPDKLVPDLTRRSSSGDVDSVGWTVSLSDALYQDLSDVVKTDRKALFWQGAVQERLGMVADRGKKLVNAGVKKGLKMLKGKNKKILVDGKPELGRSSSVHSDSKAEGDDGQGDENAEGGGNENAASTNTLHKTVGKGNYGYEEGYPNESAELEARVAFVSFFVGLYGDLRWYLTQRTPGTQPIVDKHQFVRLRASCGDGQGTSMFLLLGNLLRGTLFDRFVTARMAEVQARRPVPEDAPLFSLVANYHRMHRVDFNANNVRETARKIVSDPNLPGRYLVAWNENVRLRTLDLTNPSVPYDIRKLTLLAEDCRESSAILVDATMVLWTRIQEGRGMQWKKCLLALRVFKHFLLHGPVTFVAEAIDGFASIRILKSYTETMRAVNSAQVRVAAAEVFVLVSDLPVLFARRRECLNQRRLAKNPPPVEAPPTKDRRLLKGFTQFHKLHMFLRPAVASVAPMPVAKSTDFFAQNTEVTSSDSFGSSSAKAAAAAQSYSNDLLSMNFAAPPAPPPASGGTAGGAPTQDSASGPFGVQALGGAARDVGAIPVQAAAVAELGMQAIPTPGAYSATLATPAAVMDGRRASDPFDMQALGRAAPNAGAARPSTAPTQGSAFPAQETGPQTTGAPIGMLGRTTPNLGADGVARAGTTAASDFRRTASAPVVPPVPATQIVPPTMGQMQQRLAHPGAALGAHSNAMPFPSNVPPSANSLSQPLAPTPKGRPVPPPFAQPQPHWGAGPHPPAATMQNGAQARGNFVVPGIMSTPSQQAFFGTTGQGFSAAGPPLNGSQSLPAAPFPHHPQQGMQSHPQQGMQSHPQPAGAFPHGQQPRASPSNLQQHLTQPGQGGVHPKVQTGQQQQQNRKAAFSMFDPMA